MLIYSRHLRLFAVGTVCSLVPTMTGEEVGLGSEQPAAVKGAEREIRDLEGRINAAVVSGDLRVFEELLADDFTHTNQSGVFRTKAQWLANHKPGQSPYVAYDVDELKIRVYGDTAVVTARTTPRGQDSRGKPITGQYRYLRVWAKRDGKWRAVAFQGTRISP
jgi:ketosteroid isomerase-like protein